MRGAVQAKGLAPMDLSALTELAGGNRYFARVAAALRDDFMDRRGMFREQGVTAGWSESVNIRTGKTSPILRIRREDGTGVETGGVFVAPSNVAGISSAQILVSNMDADYRVELADSHVTVARALEIARAICVARFAVKDRRL